MSSMQLTANSICSNKSLCVVSKLKYPSFHASQSQSTAFVNLSVNASSFKQGLPILQYKHWRVGLKHDQHMHTPIVSLFGSKGKEDNGDGGSPWKAFDKVVENFKDGRSVEDVLRQQIENKEFYDGGGDGGKRPPSGGGGGDTSGGSEDHNLGGTMDETLQVVLATIGFIFMYIYIISGEELARLGKDYIKYLLGGSKSVRLKRAMNQCGSIYKRLTPQLWDHPDNTRHIVMDYIESKHPKPKHHSSSSSYDSDSEGDGDESHSDDEQF